MSTTSILEIISGDCLLYTYTHTMVHMVKNILFEFLFEFLKSHR